MTNYSTMAELYSWKATILKMWGGTAYNSDITPWTDEFMPDNGTINGIKFMIEDELREHFMSPAA